MDKKSKRKTTKKEFFEKFVEVQSKEELTETIGEHIRELPDFTKASVLFRGIAILDTKNLSGSPVN